MHRDNQRTNMGSNVSRYHLKKTRLVFQTLIMTFKPDNDSSQATNKERAARREGGTMSTLGPPAQPNRTAKTTVEWLNGQLFLHAPAEATKAFKIRH
jgi:hypothetical protein